jgi:predicted lipoprotein with Yx(FWY)xxD motif
MPSSPSLSPRHRPVAALTALVVAVLITVTACGAATGGTSDAPTTPPAGVTLLTAKGIPGTYLTDGRGRALYMWDADRHGASTCYDQCAVDWPPLTITGTATAGPGVQASLIGSTTRSDGTHQVTYGGWPLYYFAPDTGPGQLSGQGDTGYGAVWWVISPEGKPLPSEPLGTTS